MTTTDANGIVYLQDTDDISPFHTLINVLQAGTSNALDAKTRITSVINMAARDALVKYDGLTVRRLDISGNPTETWDGVGWRGDSGWVQTGLSWSAGWAAAGVTAGWQTLAWRRIGNQVWINGVLFKSSAWSPNETMFSVPAALIPASNFTGTGDFVFDIQSGSGSVRNRGAGGSGATMGIDLRYVLG